VFGNTSELRQRAKQRATIAASDMAVIRQQSRIGDRLASTPGTGKLDDWHLLHRKTPTRSSFKYLELMK
jgi:hypothetical protein